MFNEIEKPVVTASPPPQEIYGGSGQDLGIGDVLSEQKRMRLLNRNGTFNVMRNRRTYRGDFSYSTFLQMSWPKFLTSVVVSFFVINFLFAAGYVACGLDALALNGPDPQVGHFWRAYFFSVHTFATIGYGNIVPVGLRSNLLVTVESFFGLFGYSMVTGLLFARFAKPTARIRFSHKAALRTSGKPALLIRFTNASRSELIQLEATVVLAFFDTDKGLIRRYYPLPLERSRVSFLPLGWTLVHFITPESPFCNLTEQEFRNTNGEVIVQVSGTDQASSQIVYARISYTSDEIDWNTKYVDMYQHDETTGLLGIDMDKFDSTEPIS